MKKTLDEIARENKINNYDELYNYIIENLKKGKIKAIKASKVNGKKPALYNSYIIIEKTVDYSKYIDEIIYDLNPKLSRDYYLKNLNRYVEDREDVFKLSLYLDNNDVDAYKISTNERSFEIWHKEKFLTKGSGKKILKRLKIQVNDLNMYETSEPLSYYSNNKKTPQNILIIENKDTFYTFRKALIEGYTIFGYDIGTLIYGAGKGVHKVFSDININAEDYMLDERNNFYYFGDLDYEGLKIYEVLYSNMKYSEKISFDIKVFCEAYEKMIDIARDMIDLPDTAEGQKESEYEQFYSFFSETTVDDVKKILRSRKYIPQEIITMKEIING